ncbi:MULTISPECIES: glycoside hydrolase family protein [Parabacteroides]|uniref:glycoside hydrolase family protein n=1 Tax=Parabacteroides TaxID=375288 RepID=UPI0018F61117|nr:MULTISPECIES: glycoside hydrolase family protein [Parabacteroides]
MKISKCMQLAAIGCFSFLAGCRQSGMSFCNYEALPVNVELVKKGDSRFVKGPSAFGIEDCFVWGASVLKAEEDGKYYMVYSAQEAGVYPFGNAWVLGSKLGLAVSDRPDGGFKQLGFFLNRDGYAPDASSWDAQTLVNPHLRRFGNKYYLYYVGSKDPGDVPVKSKTGKLDRRSRIQQMQQIGVIEFDSFGDLLNGKFVKSETPLLSPRTRVKPDDIVSPSPEGTVAKPDNIIVVNPAVVYRPSDGKYLLYFKGNMYDPHWRGVHGVAVGDSPTGPFVSLDVPVFDLSLDDGQKLSAEDPYVWYNKKDKLFYAVFKDFTGHFTKAGPCLAIMYSEDGIDWKLPENSLFMKKELILLSGDTLDVHRLERPQLFLDENDDPQVLFAACSIDDVNPKKDGSSFNIHIPLVKK